VAGQQSALRDDLDVENVEAPIFQLDALAGIEPPYRGRKKRASDFPKASKSARYKDYSPLGIPIDGRPDW
jgi:hypothetical protein